MTTAATKFENTEISTLFLAFELGARSWKVGFTTGFGQKPKGEEDKEEDRRVTDSRNLSIDPRESTVRSDGP